MSVEPGWVRLQRLARERPETDEDAALELLKRELGATDLVRPPNADFEEPWLRSA